MSRQAGWRRRKWPRQSLGNQRFGMRLCEHVRASRAQLRLRYLVWCFKNTNEKSRAESSCCTSYRGEDVICFFVPPERFRVLVVGLQVVLNRSFEIFCGALSGVEAPLFQFQKE